MDTEIMKRINGQKQPPKLFCKKGVLRNFAKFTRKHLCKSLFFNKVAGLRPATLLKKRLWHRYLKNNSRRLLLKGCVRYIFASLFCMPKKEHL